MSFLLGRRRLFTEAEDDENTSGTDTTGGAEETAPADNASEEQPAEEQQPEEDTAGQEDDVLNTEEDDGQEEDFSIDDNVDVDTDPDTGTDDSTADTGSTDTSSEDDTPEVDKDSLKAKDAELFDTLSPDEQHAKIKALKDLYIELYTTCENLIDKFNSVSLEYDDANSQFKRIVNTLYGLKKMVSDYLLNSFDSRSYLENDIMFNRYLAVLNSIKNVSTELKKVYKDDILDS